MKSTTYIIKTLGAAAALLLGACNYLDVAPARKATLEDAMKDKMAVENWIYGCYSAVGGNVNYWGIPSDLRSYEGSTDEFAAPDLWNHHRRVVAYGNINSSNMSNARWRAYYGSIGNVHLFLRELENQNPSFLTEDDKNLYRSHAHFLKGYFYFRLLQMFGPIPLVDSYVSTSTPKKDFPGRSHFDFCVDYIYNELDQAQQGNLPGAPVVETDYGAGNKTICAALGTIAGTALALLFGLLAQGILHVDGLRLAEVEPLLQLRQTGTPLGLRGLLVAGVVISALGAVMDVAMSISSALTEVHTVAPDRSGKDLFRSGMNIGRDMVGTMTNTLILAFLGSGLVFIIYLCSLGLDPRQLVSSPYMATEVISGIASSIGVILAVPLTALITSLLLGSKKTAPLAK